MLQNFIICFKSVVPLAFYLAVGICLRKFKLISEDEVKRFTKITFVMLYPFLMFDNLYGKDIAAAWNGKMVLYAVASLALVIVLVWVLVCHFVKSNYNRGAMIQSMFRSNVVLMGLPIANYIFGKGNVTSVAVLLMFIVPIYNILAVIIFEIFRGGKPSAKHILRGVISNPLIIGGIAAAIVMLLGITVPEPLLTPIVALSDATTPVAMVLLGASLRLSGIVKDVRYVAVCVSTKLIIVPIFGIGGAILLGFTGVDLMAIILMYGTPTALASFAMASSMGGNGELAGETVVFSTLISCITLPLWLFLAMQLGVLV